MCKGVEAALFEFIRKWQFYLAEDEESRRRHAAVGGFCPVHTRRYEAVASPQGVSAAYAPVLAEQARRMRALAPRPESCPACESAGLAERTAVRDLLAALPDAARAADPPTVCLVHLEALLAAAGPEAGRALVENASAVLERVSQDMRGYLVKTAARRPTTDDEEKAWSRALDLLAGARDLCAPPRGDR